MIADQSRLAGSRLILLSITLVIAGHGCATFDSDAAHPGISQQEANVLAEHFYYSPKYALPFYTREQLAQRLRKSADPALDGEYAEAQMSSVAIALASVGDDHFADVVSHESEAVQRAVYRDVSPLWTDFGLRYSKTEALLQTFADTH